MEGKELAISILNELKSEVSSIAAEHEASHRTLCRLHTRSAEITAELKEDQMFISLIDKKINELSKK